MVRYTADCISRLDFLLRRVAPSTALPSLHCTRCMYAQQVHAYGLQREITKPHGEVSAAWPAEDVEIHGRQACRGRADQPFWVGGQRVRAAGFILQDEVLAIVC